MLVGIDYGSKLAGTTVIAYTQENEVHFMSSVKKQDADQMIINFLPNIFRFFFHLNLFNLKNYEY